MHIQLAVLGYGQTEQSKGIVISHNDYKNGYVLYAFELTADLGEDDHFNPVKHGNLCLSLKFGVALPETVSVLAYAEVDVIKLDRDCNVLVDFGV